MRKSINLLLPVQFWFIVLFKLIEVLVGSDFKEIMRTNKMLDQWRRKTSTPIYKNKRDIQICSNYIGGFNL